MLLNIAFTAMYAFKNQNWVITKRLKTRPMPQIYTVLQFSEFV